MGKETVTIKICTTTQEDLPKISKIHIASFPKSALTKLGIRSVKRYYLWLLNGPHPIKIQICAMTSKNQIAGFCFAGIFHGALSGFLSKNKFFLIGSLITKPWLLFDPIIRKQLNLTPSILDMWPNKKANKELSSNKKVEMNWCGVLSIAVHPKYTRQGIGRIMMEEIEKRSKAAGFHGLKLSVQIDNFSAISFYEKLNFIKYSEDDRWQGRMIKVF